MTVFRYVDTAAAASGDGTTRNHSGATCAYDSLANAEADIDLDWASIAAVGDDLTVKCAGSTADTTAVVWNAFGSDATYTLTIQGDDGADDSLVTVGADDGTAYNDNGRYTGNLDYEGTNYYRIEQGATAHQLDLRKPITLLGIQSYNSLVGNCSAVRVYNAQNNTASYVLDSCRLAATGSNANSRVISLVNCPNAHSVDVKNCIILKLGNGKGLDIVISEGVAETHTVYNCTFYGDDTASGQGIRVIDLGAGAGTSTVDIYNCAIAKFADDYAPFITGPVTITGNYNASDDDDIGGGGANDVLLGTHTDEWVDPTGTVPGNYDFTPKSGSQLVGAGDITYTPTYDINGKTRSSTGPDVGAVEKDLFGNPFSMII